MAGVAKKKVSELRVVDLRGELEKRGQDKTGNKAALVERLQKAIKEEGGDPEVIEIAAATDTKGKAPVKKTPTRKPKPKSKEEEENGDSENVEDGDEQLEQEGDSNMETEEGAGGDAEEVNEEEAEEEEEDMEGFEVNDDLEGFEVKDDLGEEDVEETAEETEEVEEKEEVAEEEEEVEDKKEENDGDAAEKAEADDVLEEGDKEVEMEETEEDLNEGDVINITAEDDQLLIDEVEGSSDEKVENTEPTPEPKIEEPVVSAPPTPSSAPVVAPLTKEDTIKMDTSSVPKSDDNISLVVHADDQSIMELDADLQQDEKKDGDEEKKPAAQEEPAVTSQEAAKESSDAAKVEETKAEETKEEPEKKSEVKEDKKEEAKKSDSGEKKSEETPKTVKESTTGKKSPSTTSSSSSRTKSTTSKEAGKASTKDDKDRRGSSSRTSPSSSGKNLWVSNLSSSTKATDLKSAFSKYGKVVGAKIVTSAHSPGARCYGFVTMSSHAEANKAFNHLHRTELHGRIIYVEWAKTDPAASARKPAEKKDGKEAGTKAPEPKKDAKTETKDVKSESSEKAASTVKKEGEKTAASGATAKKEGPAKAATVAKKDEKPATEKKTDEKNDKSKTVPEKKPAEKKDDAAAAAAKGRTVVMDKSKGEPVVSVKAKKDERPRSSSKSSTGTPSSHEKKPGEKKDILSFDQIKEKREKERQRQKEREVREMERRKEREKQEQLRKDRENIRRKQREEEERIRRERELVARERERLEKERLERERLEQERMRLQRERIREHERLEQERQEQRRLEAQIRLDQERRAGLKRSFESRNLQSSSDQFFSEPKRMALGFDSSDEPNRYPDFDMRDRGQQGDSSRSGDTMERRVERYDRRDGRTIDDSMGSSRYSDHSDNIRRRDEPGYRSDHIRRDDTIRRDDHGRRDMGGNIRRDPGQSHTTHHNLGNVRRDSQSHTMGGNIRRDGGQSHGMSGNVRRVDTMARPDHGRRDIRRDEPLRRDDGVRRRSDPVPGPPVRRTEQPLRRDTVRDSHRTTDRRIVEQRGSDRISDHSRDDRFQVRQPGRPISDRDRDRGRDTMSDRSKIKDPPLRDSVRGRPTSQSSRRLDSPPRRGGGISSRDEWKSERSLSGQDRRSDIRSGDRRDSHRLSDSGARRSIDSSYSHDSRQQQGHYSDMRRDQVSDSWQSRSGMQDDRGTGRTTTSTRGRTGVNFGPGLLGPAPPVQDEPQQWPQGGLENPTVNRHGERWPGAPVSSQVGVQPRAAQMQSAAQTAPLLGQRPTAGYMGQATQHPTGSTFMMNTVQVGGPTGAPTYGADRHRQTQPDARFDPYKDEPQPQRTSSSKWIINTRERIRSLEKALRLQQNKNGTLTSRGLEIQRTMKKLRKQMAAGWSGARLPTTVQTTTKPSMFLRKSILLSKQKVDLGSSRVSISSQGRGRGLRPSYTQAAMAVREKGRGTILRGRGRVNPVKRDTESEHATRRDSYRSRSRK